MNLNKKYVFIEPEKKQNNMKKTIIITIAIIILLVVGYLLISGSDTDSSQEKELEVEDSVPLEDYTDLSTDDDVFNAIDESINLIE
jgi:hypothetical protein